jgi:hypothetical protein
MRAWLMAAVGMAAFPADAWAFGGAYVGGEGVTATNQFGHVVITRLGTTSVVTVAPDVSVDAAEFGLVLPVPSAITAEDVTTVDPNRLIALDEYSAPKLLAYTCEDLYPWGGEDTGWYYYEDYYDYWYYENQRERPLFGRNWGEGACGQCGPVGCGNTRVEQPGRGYYGYYDYDYAGWDTSAPDTDTGGDSTPEVVGVAVEAEFQTGGVYDVTVLTAEESAALVEWLSGAGFAVGTDADAAFQEYVDLGWHFVVAKVTYDGVPEDGGLLPPLQLRYTSEALVLPLRLGTINAEGAQDVVVHVINDQSLGRASIVNHDKAILADECMRPGETTESFADFYDRYADYVLELQAEEDTDGELAIMRWAHEFSYAGGGCDPCGPRGGLYNSVAEAFGWDVDVAYAHVTRMRLHYNARGLDQDPVIGNQGVAGAVSLEFVDYLEELESDFMICGEGWAPDPGSCLDPREARRRTERRLPLQGSLAGTGLLLAAAYAWRRSVSRR